MRNDKQRILALHGVVIFIFILLLSRIFTLQIIESKYHTLSDGNVLRYAVEYPSRGEVYDRNGEYLVQSRECYDLMVVRREMDPAGFDTTLFCSILKIDSTRLKRQLRTASYRPRAPYRIQNFVTKEDKLLFDECNFKGFYTILRTAREYPRKMGGNLLGHVGEASPRYLELNPSYRSGDYIGIGGVESAYENDLRGSKGVKVSMVDTHGAEKGSYLDGESDSIAVQGSYLVSTIDARLQLFCEELMVGKVGAAVAIEPSSGEILMMVSSPSFDPDRLVGRERGNNYMELLNNPRNPLFNRAVSARYPPGSTFKLLQGAIGLQEGVLIPSQCYPCNEGFHYGDRVLKCHVHDSPTDLMYAIATSCNAYFCYVFNNILKNEKRGTIRENYNLWRDYVLSCGFGRKLNSDFLSEGSGYLPTTDFYDRQYGGYWNPMTIISLSIGQGELGCTPLQMANFAAIIANRGYYYIPHIIREVEGKDSLDKRFYERQYTMIDSCHFEPIIQGMWDGVNKRGSSLRAALEGYDVCGKTGTAQNPHGEDHSTFLSFAPRDNPKIAISVYVESGGFGAAAALPIASLVEEYYLTDTIRRKWLVDYIKNMNIKYPNYEPQE